MKIILNTLNIQEKKDDIEQEYNFSMENYNIQHKLYQKQCYGNKSLETLMETVFESLRNKETEIYILRMVGFKQDEIIKKFNSF